MDNRREDAPEQLADELAEVDSAIGNKVKGELASIPSSGLHISPFAMRMVRELTHH